jgi:hypothetical protein
MSSTNERSAKDSHCNRYVMACRALLCATGVLLASPAMAIADSAQFSIAAQPMSAALKTFAAQAPMQLLYQYSAVSRATANPVSGELDKHAALELLLKNTGLEPVYSSETAATIRPVNLSTSPSQGTGQASPPSSPATNTAPPPQEQPPPNPTQAAGTSLRESPASQNEATAEEDKGLQEIVVTGTLIRGINPPGASVITLDSEAITAIGATSTNQVLQNIPQLADFGNTNQQITAVNFQITVDRPNIRNLPGVGTNGGSTTLVLVDGHRLVGEGIKETAPDPNTVPVALLERVDVLPDGGSSIYGSDAIGGVINFITKRHSISMPQLAMTGAAARPIWVTAIPTIRPCSRMTALM